MEARLLSGSQLIVCLQYRLFIDTFYWLLIIEDRGLCCLPLLFVARSNHIFYEVNHVSDTG